MDPLDIVTPEHSDMFPELNLNHVGLGKVWNKPYQSLLHTVIMIIGNVDLDQKFTLPPATMINGEQPGMLSLREIVARLRHAYCEHIGVEYMFINERWAWWCECVWYCAIIGMFVIG